MTPFLIRTTINHRDTSQVPENQKGKPGFQLSSSLLVGNLPGFSVVS
jgi:hypothetical protein